MNRRTRLLPALARALALGPTPVFALVFPLLPPGAAAAAAQPAAPAPLQGPRQASAADEEPLPRWDAAAFIGWRGARIEDTYYSSSRWDARFVYGGTVGYYLTTNLKAEGDVSLAPFSRYDEYLPRTLPGAPYPLFVRSDHRVNTASFGGTLIYQFFENASFHPFLGAGAGVITIRDRITTDRQTQVFQRGPNLPPEVIVLAEEETRTQTGYLGHGLLAAGFKAYPGERVFFRTDVQWSLGERHARDISWRIGVGFDF